VLANSKYIKDFIELITSNFDESGSIVLPDALAKVVSSDAPFETISSNLAKKLKLVRQDTLLGHKRLFYAIDLANNSLNATRKTTVDFFKNSLGFLDSDIEIIDRNKLNYQ